MAHSPVLCCTAATSGSKSVRKSCAPGKYGSKKPIGVVVIKEEAGKDVEGNWLASIASGNWWHNIIMVYGFGDTHQLKPTVTGCSGVFSVNHAHEQLKESFFARAINEGAPQHLFFQHSRMHESIAATPNQLVYEGKLETANHRKGRLQDEPSLQGLDVDQKFRDLLLIGIVHNPNTISDDAKRMHAFEVPGESKAKSKTESLT